MVGVERLRGTHLHGSREQELSRLIVKPSRLFCPRGFGLTICAGFLKYGITSRDSRSPSLRSKRESPGSMSDRWTT